MSKIIDLEKAIKSVNILNIDVDESTSPKDTFLFKEEEDSYIVSDADEEILILIEFVHCVDLHNITFTALPIDENESSPPKEIHLYKTKNIDVNFDDMGSLSANKVIECKSKKLSKGQIISLHKHKKLAFRQMKYLIIYIKSNLNESEKTHLHRLQIKGICHGKLSENATKITQQIIKTFDESKYIQRIDELFKKQENKMNDEDFYDVACKEYGGNIAHFLNDYHQFIKNMDSNRLYLRQRNAVCSKKNCPFMKRQSRYKRNENGDEKSVIRQRLRQIHILCHQYDEEQKIKNDKDCRLQIIKDKQMECDDDEKEPLNNKFVTGIKAASASLNNGKYLKYSRGFLFYYHSFYRDKDTYMLEKEYNFEKVINNYISGARTATENTFKAYSFSDWCVAPKYKDLKEEIAGNDYLTMQQFDNEMEKAENNITSIEGKQLRANVGFNERFDMKAGSPISVNHMLCVMLYTNYDVLQNRFSKTFRKLSIEESDEELKQRHSAFVHLSRFLTEAVKCFGNNKSNITVHHGIDALTMFDAFSIRFSGPTSTTTSWSVACNFATNSGTVITMQSVPYHDKPPHFDCALWSDFPWEEEMLFIGMKHQMHVVNVIDTHDNIEYDKWTNVIRVFGSLLIGNRYYEYPITQFVEENIYLLIETVTNKSIKGIPVYIVDTFNNVRLKTKTLHIDMYKFSNDIVWKHKMFDIICYGAKKLKNVYFDQNYNIKWQFIKLLFPNLSRVDIMTLVPDAKGPKLYTYEESISLTDDLFNEIFHFLKNTNIDWIIFFQPQNSVDSMKELKARFDAQYEESGYDLIVGEDCLLNLRVQNKFNSFEIIYKKKRVE